VALRGVVETGENLDRAGPTVPHTRPAIP